MRLVQAARESWEEIINVSIPKSDDQVCAKLVQSRRVAISLIKFVEICGRHLKEGVMRRPVPELAKPFKPLELSIIDRSDLVKDDQSRRMGISPGVRRDPRCVLASRVDQTVSEQFDNTVTQ